MIYCHVSIGIKTFQSKELAHLFLAEFILTIKRWRMQDSVAILLG
jgi:hypothetical protein